MLMVFCESVILDTATGAARRTPAALVFLRAQPHTNSASPVLTAPGSFQLGRWTLTALPPLSVMPWNSLMPRQTA